MSSQCPASKSARPVRRVREEVRAGLAVICSSLIASTALAVTLTLLTKLAT